MKTKLTIFFFLLCFAGFQSKSQTLIQFWDFNQTRPTDGSATDSLGTVFSYNNSLNTDTLSDATWPLYTDYTAVSLAKGKIVYYRPTIRYSSIARDSCLNNGSGGSFYYDYSSNNYSYFHSSDSGFTGGNMYIRARNPSDSCEFYMYIPTTGYKNIQLDYSISQSSTKGAIYNIFSYSTNGGTTWNNLTRAMDTFNIGHVYRPDTLQVSNSITDSSSAWYPVQINFSSDPSVNSNPNFVVRWRLAGANSVGGSGNDRYDNFAVLGDIISSVNELPAQTAGYNVYPNPVQSEVTIVSNNYTGDKIITLYNVVGQIVSITENKENQTSINTSTLTSGVYFVEIKETSAGNKYTVKIVKE